MKEIPVFGGYVALVDDADYGHLSKFKWHFSTWGYATRTQWTPQKKAIFMHRQLCPTTPEKPYVDHINTNKLDNRRHNLRACTKAENGSNRGKTRVNTSGYKGVTAHSGGWVVGVTYRQKRIYIGWYKDIIEAARAYDKKARELFGEFAKLNGV